MILFHINFVHDVHHIYSCQYKHLVYRDFLNRGNLRATKRFLGYKEIRGAFITHTYVGFVKTFAVCKAGIKRAPGSSVSGVIVHNYIETQKTH